jgi:D-3-phosphoglycerate dehydrogenase
MKVLVSDNLGEDGIRMFQEVPGIDVDVKTGLEPEALKTIIADYDALVIRSATKVTEDLLQAKPRGLRWWAGQASVSTMWIFRQPPSEAWW